MQKLEASIFIQAPAAKVWETMLNGEAYQKWTAPFCLTSRFEGDWSEGSKIRFLGTDENGENEGGLVSRIIKNVPHKYISIEHVGIIKDGVEDIESEEAMSWAPTTENYTLIESDGGTEVVIDQEMDEQYVTEFTAMWQKALQVLKELSEK